MCLPELLPAQLAPETTGKRPDPNVIAYYLRCPTSVLGAAASSPEGRNGLPARTRAESAIGQLRWTQYDQAAQSHHCSQAAAFLEDGSGGQVNVRVPFPVSDRALALLAAAIAGRIVPLHYGEGASPAEACD